MKKHKIKTLVVILVIFLFLPAMCFIDSLRYPRIARSAYWRRPSLLVKATIACLFPGKGVSKEIVLDHASQLRGTDDLNIRLLYLPDLPKNDKTIKSRVFSKIVKLHANTKETLFWMVKPKPDNNDNIVIYEYRTGRVVCSKELEKEIFQDLIVHSNDDK